MQQTSRATYQPSQEFRSLVAPDPETAAAELESLLQDQAKEHARTNFLAFIKYTMPTYQVNWHHALTAWYLQEWAEGRIKRLIILEPPRQGKSQQVSRHLPAWILGRNPNEQIIATSHTQTYASSNNRKVQNIMESRAYREVFPDTRLPSRTKAGNDSRKYTSGKSRQYVRTSREFDVYGTEGHYTCAGVGGSITGEGASKFIIDDPIKNAEQANSKTIRDKHGDWFETTAMTRLEKDACVLVTLTTWHHDDIVGRIRKKMKDDPTSDQWVILRLPAIADGDLHPQDPRKPGEALWPEKHDENYYKARKASITRSAWSALYQGKPGTDVTSIIKRQWFNYYSRNGQGKYGIPKQGTIFSTWDLTFGSKKETASRVSGQVWCMRWVPIKERETGKDYKWARLYLLDRVCKTMTFLESIDALRMIAARWPMMDDVLIEKKANGAAAEEVLTDEIPGIIMTEPDGGKGARLAAGSAQVREGFVFLPLPKEKPWIDEFIDEVCGFDKWPTDDDVDTFSMALSHARQGIDVLAALSE